VSKQSQTTEAITPHTARGGAIERDAPSSAGGAHAPNHTARDRSFRPRNMAIDWLAIERDYRAGLMSLRALGTETRLFALDDRQLRKPTRLGAKATQVELLLGAASTVAITFQPRETRLKAPVRSTPLREV
jgi:hypothetical protein